MARTAVLVCEQVQAQESRLLEVLKFFGVNWQQVAPDALRNPSADLLANSEYSVFCSMSLLGAAIDASTETELPSLLGAARSVYLFGGGDSQAFGHLLRWLTGSSSAEFRCSTERSELLCSISSASDVCGPMRNLQVRATATPVSWTMQVTSPGREFTSLIAADAGSLFATVTIQGVPLFLDPNPDFIDISGPVQNGFFDVRDHFCAAVPIVMYLQSEFGHGLGYLNENGACLIVDDPVLRPQYGFVNFQQLSVLVRERDFSCTVAFIPWNYRRSNPAVVDLFKRHSDRLSLCIHGCDHTAGEFGSNSAPALNTLTKVATERMEQHRLQHGLPYDQVMVFPQGIFSPAALRVLKRRNFVAAVNTEVSAVSEPNRTRIGEVWKTAMMQHSDFALFTRRYPFHDVVNFAFDLLLGKPALITTHSADFRGNCRELLHFIDRLNGLPTKLKWRPLQEVLRRSYRRRTGSDGVLYITMFAAEAVVSNLDDVSRRVVVEKFENDAEGFDFTSKDGLDFIHTDNRLRAEFDLGPHENYHVQIRYKESLEEVGRDQATAAALKLMARRYLSEFRDEAEARAPWMLPYASKVRKQLVALRSR